jgi:hypothetical protein
VRVTYDGQGSSIDSAPPPGDTLTYEFTLKGRKDGQDSQDTKTTPARHALWRMPDGLPRYGARDVGLDDWAASVTYNWLEDHSDLVTRIDDISGEHARDLGHASHATGHDMDWFHAYTFPGGAASGTQNYLQAQSAAVRAFRGDAAALNDVTAWVTATRALFDRLLALDDVTLIISALGSPLHADAIPASPGHPAVPALNVAAGWARALLEDGSVTATTGQTLDTGLGHWDNAGDNRLRYRSDHNNHIHIRIAG